MPVEIREFTKSDYDGALALWKRCEGIGLSEADTVCAIDRFLDRNPGACFVAIDQGQVMGTILCGNDGRRGFIYHLAVDPQYRRQGIGYKLAQAVLDFLQAAGIQKVHIMVYHNNEAGKSFWQSAGWKKRDDVELFYFAFQAQADQCAC
jgi:ribosomal protein S18 acetylase RimI-like enzyme